MKKYRNVKNRINWKTVILAAVSVALVAALAVTGITLFNKKDKDSDGYVQVDPQFTIGGLTETGAYKDTNASLYTKEAIEADSVRIKLEFDSNVKYQLFFYDENGNFVSAGTSLASGSTTETLPEGATCFRIVITPTWGEDVEEDDQKVTIFNKYSFEKQLTVSIVEPAADETPDETPDAE